jgi:hypothetical protein
LDLDVNIDPERLPAPVRRLVGRRVQLAQGGGGGR